MPQGPQAVFDLTGYLRGRLARLLSCMLPAIVVVALAMVVVPVHADEALSTERQWRFQVFLDDKEIGYHDFFLEQRGESQVLRTVAEFEYKLLFVKLYDYEHENSEEWRDGCLSRIESSTDDNGKTFAVLGQQQPGAFVVQAKRGAASLPPCVMSFAYWDPVFLQQKQLLNSQNGEYVEVQVSAPETTELEVQGEMRKAMRYHLAAGPLKLQLWYSMDSEWLGLESETESGRVLRYKLL
jgi:hypothetical protein